MNNSAICLKDNKNFEKGKVYASSKVYSNKLRPGVFKTFIDVLGTKTEIDDENFCFIINPVKEIEIIFNEK